MSSSSSSDIVRSSSAEHDDGEKATGNKAMAPPEDIVSGTFLDNDKDWLLLPGSLDEPIWNMYKKAQASFWTAEEVDLTQDCREWRDRLNDNERFYLKHVLGFFASSDGIVNENLAVHFLREFKNAHIRCFYSFQAMMENVHAEMYSLFITTLIREPQEQQAVLHAVETMPAVREKADWALKWISDKTVGLDARLVAFAAVEGIFFSGSFCAIFWLRKRGLMPGLCSSNEFIARDEGMHCDFACLLYSQLERRTIDGPRAKEIVLSACACEKHFVTESLPVALLGMNNAEMAKYIEFVTDRLLVALGLEKHFKTANPFPWMELISLQGKTNFFERRTTEYSRAGLAHIASAGKKRSREIYVDSQQKNGDDDDNKRQKENGRVFRLDDDF
jgi:ribonucleotide reductase beta subunit family protein with ferritin-like domain